jgi:hypothetical protein
MNQSNAQFATAISLGPMKSEKTFTFLDSAYMRFARTVLLELLQNALKGVNWLS